MVILTNTAFPHTGVIKRTTVVKTTAPFTATTATIWSGAVDCQITRSGGTEKIQSVFVSDYTIFSALIPSALQKGDTIEVNLGTSTIKCTIEQHDSSDIYSEDGITYGTTIWANLVAQ